MNKTTGFLFFVWGLGAFGVVAGVSYFFPDQLATTWGLVRVDTFGISCFVMSVFGFFVFNGVSRDSIMSGMLLFGLIVVIYEVGVAVFQPFWITNQVTHLLEGVSWLTWLTNQSLASVGAFSSSVGLTYMLGHWISRKGKIVK